MKFVHFSDTHLGFSDLNKVEPKTGINQREADFYEAWWRAIDLILELKPDFAVHAGDLFQSPRPNNRAIRVALEGIQRLGDGGVPLVVVSGNHSTPRIRQTGSIFESLALFPEVYPAYENRYIAFRIGTAAIHCIPHCSLSEELTQAWADISADPDAKYQILVTHGAWRESSGDLVGSVGEFNEQFIENPAGRVDVAFDYIALGHYHKHLKVGENAYYSGSTERTSFNEIGYSSGLMLVDLEAGTREYLDIPFRPMCQAGPIDCSGMLLDDVYAAVESAQLDIPDGALVRLVLQGLAREVLLSIDLQKLDANFPNALHVEKVLEPEVAAGMKHTTTSIGSLSSEFSQYLDRVENLQIDRTKLLEIGLQLLDDANEETGAAPR